MTADDEARGEVGPTRPVLAELRRVATACGSLAGRLSDRLRNDGVMETARVCKRYVSHGLRAYGYVPVLRLLSDDGFVHRSIDGRRLVLDLDDPGLSRRLLVYGEHEPGIEAIWTNVLEPGMTVVDVGSNFGYFSLMAAEHVGERGHVHAIEPVPANHDLLQRNVRENDCENVSTYRVAVGSSVGTKPMALTAESNWNTLLDRESDDWASEYVTEKMDRRTRETVEVETTTLSVFVEEHDVGSVDAFRMDIEGYELEVTRGMTDLLAAVESPCWAFLEVHNKHFRDHERVVTELVETYERCGFRPYALLLGNEAVPVDDDFLDVLSSYDDACPHVVFVK